MDWAQSLPEDASLLLVLDYPAAFSAEMRLIATPVLRTVFAQGGTVSILTSAPAGRLLFDQLLADAELPEALIAQDLGYYPVGSFGAYGLAQQALPPQNQLDLFNALPFEGFAGIVILGDDYEGAMAWIEQFSSLAPETPIFLLVSAQAGPLLLPYYESGQVRGMISGVSDAVDLVDHTTDLAQHWRAYQVGNVLMILMLLIGMSFPASHRQPAEGQDER